jgi:ABC-type transporter Mla subunit MlaD
VGARVAVIGLLLAGVVAVVVVVAGGAGDSGRVFVTVREAVNVVGGQEVRSAGRNVGEVVGVEPVNGGRAARIELELRGQAWPLPAGSRMALRWGGTANYSNRYIALVPGRGGGELEDGGTLPSSSFRVPVEFDSLLRTFPADVRQRLRAFLDNGGAALREARPSLREAVDVARPAVSEARAVLDDLDADHAALHQLVTSTDRVLGAVDAAEPGMREMLSGAGGTFDALGRQSGALQDAIELAPQTFARARTTLARADGTLEEAGEVVKRLEPGVAQVRAIARPLNGLLGTAVDVGPDARSTLASLRQAAPDLNRLMARATELSPQIGRVGKQSVENLKCIRPYTPDAIAFFTNWGDFFSVPDSKDKLIRAQVQSFLPAQHNTNMINSGEAARLYPGLEFGFPRPPGTNAGQPWFLPECGAGPEALDPAKDPEARPFSDVMKIPSLRKAP